MTDREVALEIVIRNEKIIRGRLFTDGYMFDDELHEGYITSPVARELASCIEEYFHLENEQFVIRQEMDSKTRSNGVFYFSECELEYPEVQEIAKEHYSKEIDFE